MSRVLALTIVAALGFVPVANVVEATPTSATQIDEAVLIQSERAWAQAAVARDVATFRSYMADEYVQLILQPATSTARASWVSTTKDGWTELLTSGGEQNQSVELRNLRVYLQGNVATVSGEYSQKGRKNGAANNYDSFYVDIWVKRNGAWRVISSAFP